MAFEFVTADIRSVVCDAIVEFCSNNKDTRIETESIQSSNCKYIIRVSLPFPADMDTEMMMIRSSYRSLLNTIAENKFYTVAVPLHQKYNIFEVNELLYDYNQPILGKQEKEKSPPKRPK